MVRFKVTSSFKRKTEIMCRQAFQLQLRPLPDSCNNGVNPKKVKKNTILLNVYLILLIFSCFPATCLCIIDVFYVYFFNIMQDKFVFSSLKLEYL